MSVNELRHGWGTVRHRKLDGDVLVVFRGMRLGQIGQGVQFWDEELTFCSEGGGSLS